MGKIRELIDRIFLFFDHDLEVSRWLKSHGGKPIEKIVASMSEAELKQAEDFFMHRPIHTDVDYSTFSYSESQDSRVEKCLHVIQRKLEEISGTSKRTT